MISLVLATAYVPISPPLKTFRARPRFASRVSDSVRRVCRQGKTYPAHGAQAQGCKQADAWNYCI